jgi:hypothetical protein
MRVRAFPIDAVSGCYLLTQCSSHRCGLPTDYSTPFQCLGYSGYAAGGYGYSALTASSDTSGSTAQSSVETSPQSTSTSSEEPQRIACRHVYCLGCQWLVNGEFRVLHPIEIRDESADSAQGYGRSATEQQSESRTGRRARGHGSRKSRS